LIVPTKASRPFASQCKVHNFSTGLESSRQYSNAVTRRPICNQSSITMPPKAVRGAGRGRGRGRGKAPASSLEEHHSISQSITQGDVDSQSAMASSSSLELPIPKSTTPQNEFLDADPSPNSSPATVWTETPAPTPIRPPSTLKTESSSRILPPTRGGITSRGSEVKATGSRFKPKNIRRDAKELEDLQKKEKIRLDAIAAEEAKKAARAARGRGWGMRGRGDAMGRGGGRARIATASGTFGVVPEGLRELQATKYID
jgi:DNA-directed RNA polymerase III subunit RPC4